jgi:hypothetical protein
LFLASPATFLEPGVEGRWIFDEEVAVRIASLVGAIAAIESRRNARLLRVLLGGILVDVSNVITSGKGRRYRKNWVDRRCAAQSVDELFAESVESAIDEIHRYSRRPCMDSAVLTGDARKMLSKLPSTDLAVFSPPYPNSFDYTDVYNIELWTLGYLKGKLSNTSLRNATLSSHVQILREFAKPPRESKILLRTLKNLGDQRSELWNRHIPEMVGGYFADMAAVMAQIRRMLPRQGAAWIVVGDSQYADVPIKTSHIICELTRRNGWVLDRIEPFRAMRSSVQQGGRLHLNEELVVLLKS